MKEKPLISVITVSYNAVLTLEKTILNVINQDYSNVEYIIIDGGSVDGTVDIITKYQNRISYWISEPDKGIYDAMNKGILRATGEWINFMNSGDSFVDNTVLSSVFAKNEYVGIGIIYGNSLIKKTSGVIMKQCALTDLDRLEYSPIYRHGASFVQTSIQKLYLFDVSQKRYGYALDYNCIYTLYKKGYRFSKVNMDILVYEEEGASNHPLKSAYYNFLITTRNGVSFRKVIVFLKNVVRMLCGKFLS